MKKIAITAIAAFIAAPALAAPGDTASADGQATAEIVAPLSITHDTGAVLHFGTIVPGSVADTVTVTAGGVASTGAGEATLVVGATSPSADSFSVTGDPARNFDIVTGAGTVTSGGGATMGFTTAPSSTVGAADGSGNFAFTVGGTLSVGAGQAVGSYAGTYTATVTYN